MSSSPRMALTFDDGPSEWTEDVLDLLAEHRARATFFLIGRYVSDGQETVRRIQAEGHEIGNHSWSHPWLARDCGADEIRDELRRTNEALALVTGSAPRRFRAPRYDVNELVLEVGAELGLTHTPGDITPPDWDDRCTTKYIAAYVVGRARPGAVIGLHDGDARRRASRRRTVDALRIAVPRLVERGFELVTASTLLGPR